MEQQNLVFRFLIKSSPTTCLFKYLKLRYNRAQIEALNAIVRNRARLCNIKCTNLFLTDCIVNKVCPRFIASRIKRAKLQRSTAIEGTFLQNQITSNEDEILKLRRLFTNRIISGLTWLSSLDGMRLLKYLSILDQKRSKWKRDKNIKMIDSLKRVRFGTIANSDTCIRNFTS